VDEAVGTDVAALAETLALSQRVADFIRNSGLPSSIRCPIADPRLPQVRQRLPAAAGRRRAGRCDLDHSKPGLQDAENLRQVGREFKDRTSGILTIATTHTQARYSLPRVVGRSSASIPRCTLASAVARASRGMLRRHTTHGSTRSPGSASNFG